jgi:3-hydroxymyristoyl/3-hydroxydecanoyl-(acyl carrier protein) dehydratase
MSADTVATDVQLTKPVLLDETITPERIELSLEVPSNLVYFRGHFPGFPILPGVVQIDWVIEYVRHYFNLECAAAAAMRVKFRQPIKPGDHLRLTLNYHSARQQIEFVYALGDGIASSGRIRLIA